MRYTWCYSFSCGCIPAFLTPIREAELYGLAYREKAPASTGLPAQPAKTWLACVINGQKNDRFMAAVRLFFGTPIPARLLPRLAATLTQ